MVRGRACSDVSGDGARRTGTFTGRLSEGQKAAPAGKVERFVSGLFVQLNKAIVTRQGGRGQRSEYAKSFDEENPCKQPLLVKTCDVDARGPDVTVRHSDSWKIAAAAEHERHDAAEARGHGVYSLHAVLGQGSFGRIHLASWRGEGDDSWASCSSTESKNECDGSFGTHTHLRTASAGSFGKACFQTEAEFGQTRGDTTAGQLQRQQGTTAARERHRDRPAAAQPRGDQEGVGEGWGLEPRLRALKSVCKRKVTEKGLVRHIETELAVLKQCNHPFIVSLSPGGQFQTSRHLHLVLDYCPGGDLFSLLGREGRLAEPQVRVCAAQIALALRHLHSRHVVYRDLKPENVCLDARGRAILVDFSLARTGLDSAPGGKAFTFCGSAAYAAPEMLSKGGHDTRVDFWSLGCVVFEALVGAHPFRRPRGERTDRQALFERIRRGSPDYPPFLSASALSLLQGLLAVNPDNRLRFGPPSSRSKKQPYLAADIAISRAADAPDIAPPLPSTIHRDGDESGASEGGGVGGARPDVGQSNGSKHGDGIAAIPLEAPSEQCGNRLQNCSANVTGAVSDSWCDDVAREGCGNGENASVGKEAEDNSLGAESAVETPGSSGSAKSVFLLEHCFFCGLPGWGGPGTEGAWDELKLEESAVVVPELRHALDVKHFDPRFTSQAVELILQGHPHKGGPTPSFDEFDVRADSCIEYAQAEERNAPGFLGSMASALWC